MNKIKNKINDVQIPEGKQPVFVDRLTPVEDHRLLTKPGYLGPFHLLLLDCCLIHKMQIISHYFVRMG